MNAIELSLISHRLAAVCEEMGAVLRRSALSPNIKDREDYSCALFDAKGELVAQAAHIPVHLGSMAFAMRDVIGRFDWNQGDTVIFNDPFLGGTHLPDLTVVMPVILGRQLLGFAAARAHHADVGGASPGSMGIYARLDEEGVVISPRHWWRRGKEDREALAELLACARNSEERLGDLSAQRAACALGARRLLELQHELDVGAAFAELLHISEAYGRQTIEQLADGRYRFAGAIEDDGFGSGPLPIQVEVRIAGGRAEVDFAGTADQCAGPMNCPLAVTAAAVYYCFRCLMPEGTPQTAAVFRPIRIHAPSGCLVHAEPGAAVAGGNVETSQRIVDVVLRALAQAVPERIPAAAQGTMNNVLFGTKAWVYYETLAGGMGAHAHGNGLTAVQCHMTNTKNTAIEVLEMHYPLRILRYAIRRGSGGAGRYRGGDGLVREWEVLEACTCSLLSERRKSRPYGLQGGEGGKSGQNFLIHQGHTKTLPAKCTLELEQGDVLRVETPGGGGFGRIAKPQRHGDTEKA